VPRQPVAQVRTSPVMFVTASAQELRKVTWPHGTVFHHGTVVALFIAVMIVVLLLVDSVGSLMLEWLSR
jgi:preprotein translocase SecE subunit